MKYAMDEYGNIVHVDFAENGAKCNSTCLRCGKSVVAKQGNQRDWFYAHAIDNAECNYSNESEIHYIAKTMIVEAGGLWVPDEKSGDLKAFIKAASAENEIDIGNMRVDTLLKTENGDQICIEIAKTSFVSGLKYERVLASGIRMLEIDISSISDQEESVEYIRRIVIDGVDFKKWINSTREKIGSNCVSMPKEKPANLTNILKWFQHGSGNFDATFPDGKLYFWKLPSGDVTVKHDPWKNVQHPLYRACRKNSIKWDGNHKNWICPRGKFQAVIESFFEELI